MEKELKMNLTMNGNTVATILPVDDQMTLIDFFYSLHLLLKSLNTGKKPISTFDVYDLSFQRIAIVGDNSELFIEPAYENLTLLKDLFDVCIDTIEVIALGNTSVSKVLEEEKYLKTALDNYKFDE